jgi:hypothetical protein
MFNLGWGFPLLNGGPMSTVVAHVHRPRLDDDWHATGLDRNELGTLLVAAGLGSPAEHALISLRGSMGSRYRKPLAPTLKPST